MKNKKIIVITLLSIIIGLVILNLAKTKDIGVEKTQKRINTTNMLTMMLETEAGTGNYEEVKQSEWPQDGYVFNKTLSKCENGSELSWDDSAKKVIFASTKADRCYIYFDIKTEPTFAEYIKDSVYTTDGENGLYYHDGIGSYTNASEEARDNSYRYSGADPNNYVCFGSDATTCPSNNLYRIIGLFDDDQDGEYNLKIIKADYANNNIMGTNGDLHSSTYTGTSENYYKGDLTTINSYYWNNNTKNNSWSESNLNKINLNTNYWNKLGSKWQEQVKETEWQVGGNTVEKIYEVSVQDAYENEIKNPATNIKYKDEVGLMYVSDYGYAASPDNWQTSLDSYDTDTNRNNNWLFMGIAEWTITRREGTTNKAYGVRNMGTVYIFGGDYGAARPVINLKEEVKLANGQGSKESPYRIKFENTGEETTHTGAEYIINEVYTTDGANGLYYHDGIGTYTNASEEAGDNSYRYSGANPNNYVCFGSDAVTCPNDNLYRIIGLFDDDKDGNYNIKLIKYDYATTEMLGTDGCNDRYQNADYYRGHMDIDTLPTYKWNHLGTSDYYGSSNWITSELNNIHLNEYYLNYLYSINSKWVDMIATTTWYLGGLDSYYYTAKEFYEGERNNAGYGSNPTTYSDEIGLMYPSDYGYAASPGNWTTDLHDYGSMSWMFMGLTEWTITPYLSYSYTIFNVYDERGLTFKTYAIYGSAVRPVFYLESNVQLEGGSGTSSDPYRLAI